MGMWSNHRHRQAGKYAKQLARTVSVQQDQIAALTQAQQVQQQLPAAPVQMMQQPQQEGMFSAGYERGWRDGQADLIRALREGRVRWEDLPY